MLPCQTSPGQYISNQHEDCGRDEGNHGRDEVVAVLEIVAEEGEIMAEIVEEAEQAEEAKILR